MFVKLKCHVSLDGQDYGPDDTVELPDGLAANLIERDDAVALKAPKPPKDPAA